MNIKEQMNNIRRELVEIIRQAVEKENNCIGTFYKNKGCRSFLSQIKDEYDNSPAVVVHNTDFIDSYGYVEPADVVDLYINTELQLMCTVNGISCEDWDEPIENLMTDSLLCIIEWLEENGFIMETYKDKK
jgi:hypothetical protein